mgnify:CR=1 FL=1
MITKDEAAKLIADYLLSNLGADAFVNSLPPPEPTVTMRGAFIKLPGCGTWYCSTLDEDVGEVEAREGYTLLDLKIPLRNLSQICEPEVAEVK